MRVPAFLLVLLLALTSFAQSSPDEIIREFFNTYSAGRTEQALEDLYGHSKWFDRNSDAVGKVRVQLLALKGLVGEYRGYSLLGSKDLQADLVIYDYMVKFDRQPVRFRFTFYRADKEWATFSFGFDDNLDEELEELVKGTYLHQ